MSTFCPVWARTVERRSDGYTRYEVARPVTVVLWADSAGAHLATVGGELIVGGLVGFGLDAENGGLFDESRPWLGSTPPTVVTVTVDDGRLTSVSFGGAVCTMDRSTGVERRLIQASSFVVSTERGAPVGAEEIALRVIGGQP